MNVLFGCSNFKKYTGSELYVYELAKELSLSGINVTICSDYGDPLATRALKHNIKLFNFKSPPKNDFDVLHLNHTKISEFLLKTYPNVPAVATIHSEVISSETPVIHENIKKYVAIRPEIEKHLIKKYRIPKNLIEVIYNPIDTTRFNEDYPDENNNKLTVLFVGTIDYLRKSTILDLIKSTRKQNKNLWIVGRENGVTIKYLKFMAEKEVSTDHVSYYNETWDVEDFVKKCDQTAGILLGRTTIEGWLCGKPSWIYDVDDKGNIKSKSLVQPHNDLTKFHASNVAKQIMEIYEKVAREK